MEKQTEKKSEVKKACKVKDCKKTYRSKGYCAVHFKKWRRGELEGAKKPRYRICGEENCKKPTFKKGYCEQHYSAWSASKKGAPASAPAEAVAAATPAPETEKPAEQTA